MVRALQPADPRLIGPYRLVGQLGAGGMGRVFLAMSAGGRPVAVKMIRAELAADPDFRSRFSREVSAARRVNGLFTALVVDADVDAQVPWLATAYVAGPSLAETVKEHGPLSAKSVLALAAGLAEGLNAIHAAGVVHGDLKPSNVLLAEDGPRVIDFGISHAAETAPLTHPGLVMGSPGFMSPEQALGKKVGPRSDVFSLGAVLAYAASARRALTKCRPKSGRWSNGAWRRIRANALPPRACSPSWAPCRPRRTGSPTRSCECSPGISRPKAKTTGRAAA
jgi:serine/threonine protein kinase